MVVEVVLGILIGLGSLLLISSGGVMIGAAVGYGVPKRHRRSTALPLAFAWLIAVASLLAFGIANPEEAGAAAVLLPFMFLWMPGFIAGVLGANRWLALVAGVSGWLLLYGLLSMGLILGL